MPVYAAKPSREHPRRRIRLGGYVIDNDTCRAWGSRIAKIPFPPEHLFVAYTAIDYKLDTEHNMKFTPVGEDESSKEWMLVTQSADFDGWKDMDPALIPQFEEGHSEEIARKLLVGQGT